MDASTRTVGSVVILDLEGRLTVEVDVARLEERIQELIRQRKNIVLNLQGVPALDCAGIGFLVTSYCAVQESGAQLKLVHVQDRPAELLAVAGLLTVLKAYDKEGDAVASFGHPHDRNIHAERQFYRLEAITSQVG